MTAEHPELDSQQDSQHVSTWLAELARAPPPGDVPKTLKVGESVGGNRYQIRRELGRGGMGIVYEAEDTKLDRRVALKTHQTASIDARRRILVEAQAMAKLSHPHVVAVHDVGEFDGGVFLVADLIRGGDLETWRTPERTWSEIVGVYIEAGRGLAYAHAAGLVHRDFKPANVLVGLDGRCQVTDFGIAVPAATDTRGDNPLKDGDEHGDTAATATDLVGTPAYMAPEQLQGAPADARSDQFSYCVALYEALTGARPYPRTAKELRAQPLQLRTHSAMPRRVQRLLQQGLSARPADRFPSLDALLGALERTLNPRRATWLTVGGVGLAGVTLLAFGDTPTPCEQGITAALDGWSHANRQELRARFVADPEAAKLWPGMKRAVDAFSAEWARTATRVCEGRDTTTQALTHAAQRCLDDARRDADATLASLRRAPSRASRSGPERVAAWTSPSECSRARFVLASPSIPVLLRAHVRVVEETLRALSNEATTSSNPKTLEPRLAEARRQVEILGAAYPPLRARLGFIEADVVGRGRPRDVEAILKQTYHDSRASNHPDYAVLAALGLTDLFSTQLGDIDAALEWAEVARVEAARDGVSNRRVVEVELAVAIAYDIAGRWDEAATMYEEALELTERLTGEERERERGRILISLSGFESARGNLDRAISTGTEAVELFETLEGGPCRSSVNARGNVALALLNGGRLDEAQATFEQEREERIALLGPDHPAHITTQINLGVVAAHQERYEVARAHWTSADAAVERFYGEEHPDRAGIALKLGWLDETAGAYPEAEARYTSALRVFKKTLGEEAEATLLCQDNLASARLKQGKIEAACAPLEGLIETAQATLGETRVVARFLNTRGDCAVAQGRPNDAVERYRSSLAVMKKISEPAGTLAEVQLKLASALWTLGSKADAQATVDAVGDTPDARAWRNAHDIEAG